MEFLRRQADIVVAIGVLLGASSAIILACGGSIPPWYSIAQAATDQRTAADIQKDTVAALQRLNSKLDGLQRHVEQGDCNTLSETYEKARLALEKSPTDPIARALADNARGQMRDIQGCMP